MNDCSPEIMTAVPRFYQNLCIKKLMHHLIKQLDLKKVLIDQTIGLGKEKIV